VARLFASAPGTAPFASSNRAQPQRLAVLGALLIAGLVAAIGLRSAFFVAGGTDSSGYVSAAERWRAGDIFAPAPLHLWAAWPNAVPAASPVAYRPALISGTDIPVYPLGLPVFFAAAASLGGALAPFVVAPVFAAILTWCAFVLARMHGGPVAGLITAVLVAASPVTLLHTVDAMSDVPAAGLFAMAWVMSLARTKGGALAAGAAVTAMVMVRPNLAPLAVIPGGLVLLGTRWRGALLFTAAASVGPILVAWSQTVLYGGPFVPGYVEWEGFFRAAHVLPNLELYPRLTIRVFTPIILLGVLGALATRSIVGWSALAVLLLNVAIYLPYLSLDDWPFLRFLLPGLTALFILFAGLVVWFGAWLAARSRRLAPLALVPVAVVLWQGAPMRRYALTEWTAQARVMLMGRYLREVLPANAAVLSFFHSGAVRHYTGRQIVRLDLLEPASLDRVVDDLRRYGYDPVFVIDESIEAEAFRARFVHSRFGRLDWPPRAVFTAVSRIWYFDAADRERHSRGERWPIDQVK